MPVPPRSAKPSLEEEARALLLSTESLDLERYSVVGPCLRFDEGSRNRLKDLRQRVGEAYLSHRSLPTNFLLWGAPGSGKSYLVGQIARSLPSEVNYLELNLTQQEAEPLRAALEGFLSRPGPAFCFLDEIDARPDQAWPYEVLLPFLEPPVPREGPTVFCLAGSGGANLAEFEDRIRRRPKGTDLLSRVPRGNAFTVEALGVGDKVLVSAVQLLLAAREEGRPVEEVEKLALYYLAVHPAYTSARQLRGRAADGAQRMPMTETRIRYDHLFPAGDPENKRFWTRLGSGRAGLEGSYVRLRPGPLGTEKPARRPEAIGAPAPPSRPPEGRAPPRVAVLPLANISPDPRDEYLADGLTEELIASLSRVKGLRVISRTSMAQYKGTTKTVGQIGAELKVDAVLEGSVRKVGEQVRITMQLIDVASDEHRWAESYDRKLENVFAVQAEVAEATARMLRVELLRSEQEAVRRRPTGSEKAYEAYLRGIQVEQRVLGLFRENFDEGVKHFEEATREDPGFSQAYAELANHLIAGAGILYPFRKVTSRVQELVHRAMALNPELPDAHVAMGNLAMQVDHDWGRAEAEFRSAIALNPSHSRAHFWYAYLLETLQRYTEGQREYAATLEVDPLWDLARYNSAIGEIWEGDPASGLDHLEKLSQQYPQSIILRGTLATELARLGRSEEARKLLETLVDATGLWARVWRGWVRAILGDATEIRAFLQAWERGEAQGYLGADRVAVLYASVGEKEKALDVLERDLREGDQNFWAIYRSPFFDPLRREPRFLRLLQELGLPTGPIPRPRSA